MAETSVYLVNNEQGGIIHFHFINRGDKKLVRNWSSRAKDRAPANTNTTRSSSRNNMQGAKKKRISSTGDLRLFRRSKCRSKDDEEEGGDTKAKVSRYSSFPGKIPSQSQPAASLQNENWDDEDLSTSSAPIATSWKLSKHEPCFSITRNTKANHPKSQSLPLKPSLKSGSTSTSEVTKHVRFSRMDEEIRYVATKDDIKKSWLDIDVTKAIEANGYKSKSNDLVVSFGPTGRSTLADIDIYKGVKEYMVRIQQRRLINEILGQREILRESVFEEQARQKREGIVDAEEMCAVASKQSKWGVELAKSSWWLSQS